MVNNQNLFALIDQFAAILDLQASNVDDNTLFLTEILDTIKEIEAAYISFIVSSVSTADVTEVTTYYRKTLHPFLLQSPFMSRCFHKPLGYAGDYEMIHMIHSEPKNGNTRIGKLLNELVLKTEVAEAARQRTKYISNLLLRHMKINSGKCKIMSVACGPALEIANILQTTPDSAIKSHFTLLDQEREALAFCNNTINTLCNKIDVQLSIDYIHKKIQDFIADKANKNLFGQFSLVYSFGLFDYFDYRTARLIIKCLLPLLCKSGKLVIANLSLDGHRSRALMEMGLDWHLVYRSRIEMHKLAESIDGISNVAVDEISNRLVKILTITV
ncbi:hypothetical protein ACFL47_05060 [Candidatus Latescibacterota bacterium]